MTFQLQNSTGIWFPTKLIGALAVGACHVSDSEPPPGRVEAQFIRRRIIKQDGLFQINGRIIIPPGLRLE